MWFGLPCGSRSSSLVRARRRSSKTGRFHHPDKSLPCERLEKQTLSCNTLRQSTKFEFQDSDGDVIQLKLDGDRINEFVNYNMEVENVSFFRINQEDRTYSDPSGHGTFVPDENLGQLVRLLDVLFKKRSSESLSCDLLRIDPFEQDAFHSAKNYSWQNLPRSPHFAFQDSDGDVVRLKLEDGQANEYVNGKLVIEGVTFFHIDVKDHTYKDANGCGKFKSDEDIGEVVRLRDALFREKHRCNCEIDQSLPLVQWPHGSGPWIASSVTCAMVTIRGDWDDDACPLDDDAWPRCQAAISNMEKRCFPERPWNYEQIGNMLRSGHVLFAYISLSPKEYLKFLGAFAHDTSRSDGLPRWRGIAMETSLQSSERVQVLAGCIAVQFRHNGISEVLSLAVEPFFQGIGIGDALLSFALSQGVAWQLHVRVDNAVARRLYCRHGFRATGRVRGYYQDGIDAFTMHCDMQI